MADKIILYSYFRSSASYRVRIALHHKELDFEYRAVHLLKDGGKQFTAEYKALNPMSQVPCLIHNDQAISQSMAIIEYLDAVFPERNLFPRKPFDRAIVMQICETVNSGIQPLHNSAVMREIEKRFGAKPDDREKWIQHWIRNGLNALNTMLLKCAGEHAFGDSITAADCFIVPQVFAAKRFAVDLSDYPEVDRINQNASRLESFQKSEPAKQPDFEA